MTLANVAGIADALGVSRSAVSNWEARNADYPQPLDFPHVIGVPLWDLEEVRAWRIRKTVTHNSARTTTKEETA